MSGSDIPASATYQFEIWNNDPGNRVRSWSILRVTTCAQRRHLDATLFVVLHLAPTSESWLAAEIRRATGLQVETPDGEQAIEHRHIYVASSDRHLIVRQGKVVSNRGPRENMWRPALDVLFRTAAVAHGPRVIGILLSGELDDGTAGLQAIKACGWRIWLFW